MKKVENPRFFYLEEQFNKNVQAFYEKIDPIYETYSQKYTKIYPSEFVKHQLNKKYQCLWINSSYFADNAFLQPLSESVDQKNKEKYNIFTKKLQELEKNLEKEIQKEFNQMEKIFKKYYLGNVFLADCLFCQKQKEPKENPCSKCGSNHRICVKVNAVATHRYETIQCCHCQSKESYST